MAETNSPRTRKPSRVKRVLGGLTILVGVCILSVVGCRAYNDHRYAGDPAPATPAYYRDPANLSLYPTNIAGVTVRRVDSGAAQGFRLTPDELRQPGTVVVFGGSEGTPAYERATELAQNGYEVLSLFMFGQKNQPKTLVRIPLEQFADALALLGDRASSEPLTVIGASKGAEYALELATRYPEIDNLVLIAPSAYTFNGLDFENYGSSWTWRGEELPYVDVTRSSFTHFISDTVVPLLTRGPVTYRSAYATAVEGDAEAAAKAIPVGDTQARMLLLAGSDDQMWDSAAMAEAIRAARPEGTVVRVFDGAGHVWGGGPVIDADDMRINVGGTVEANAQVAEKGSALILEQLEAWHGTGH